MEYSQRHQDIASYVREIYTSLTVVDSRKNHKEESMRETKLYPHYQ